MAENNNFKITQPKLQMQRFEYTEAQSLNEKQSNSMFSNVFVTSVLTDNEKRNKILPKKILHNVKNSNNTSQQPSIQDLGTSTNKINATHQEVGINAANILLKLRSGYLSSTNKHSNNNGNDNRLLQCDLKESPLHYSLLPTTTSTTNTRSSYPCCPLATSPAAHTLAMLKMGDSLLYIKNHVTIIGRNCSTSKVHFHVANNTFVSRKHFQIDFDPDCGEFILTCGSKNGIFVDDNLQHCYSPPKKLPKSCIFRFPSTELLIHFNNFIYKKTSELQKDCNLFVPIKKELPTLNPGHHFDYMVAPTPRLASTPSCSFISTTNGSAMLKKKINANSNEVYSTRKISKTNLEAHSNAYTSSTGTFSEVNSYSECLRQSFPDYQTFCGNGNRNSFNNYDAFGPLSTLNVNKTQKPPYSYSQLIIQSIATAPSKQLKLSGIYKFITKNYPYYYMTPYRCQTWQNSIRHNLSLCRYFIKVAKTPDEPGRGSFWRIDPNFEAKLIACSFNMRRLRPFQRMPHLAPVTLSYRDTPRENSPLPDVMLQSESGLPEITMIKKGTIKHNKESIKSKFLS